MGSSTAPAGSPPAATTASRDDHRARLNDHMANIRAANQGVELARAPFDAARDNLTAAIDEARADLGKKQYTRKRLMSYLEDMSSRLRNLLAEEEQRYQDRLDLGLPVHGEQLMLTLSDENTPQEAKDEMFWEREGFMLGRLGKLNQVPDGCPPRFHQKVMAAAEKGQELTRAEVLAAQKIKETRGQPAADQKAVDLNGDGAEPDDKQVAAAKAALDKIGTKKAAPKPTLVASNPSGTSVRTAPEPQPAA